MALDARRDSNPLAGIGILVTRPAHQAGPLCERLKALGADVALFPTIEIQPLAPDGRTARMLAADWVIFVSANAVRCALDLLVAEGKALGGATRVAAIGAATAGVLRSRGVAIDSVPEGRADSESLLRTESLQNMAGKRVAIVRGEGGRELLARELRSRGARVEYVEVYRRFRPRLPEGGVDLRRRGIAVVVVTSVQGLTNLVEMTPPGERDLLQRLTLATFSARVGDAAEQAGFQGVILVASRQSDDGLVDAILSASKQGRIPRFPNGVA